MVLGSSNASTNGHWIEGPPARGWFEANVLIEDAAVLAEVREWFDLRWEASERVTEKMIEAVRPLWTSGRGRAPSGNPLGGSLLAAYEMDPDHPFWARVKVAFCTEPLSAKGRAERKAIIAENPAFENLWHCEGWTGEFSEDDLVIGLDRILGKKEFALARSPVEIGKLTFLRPVSRLATPFGALRVATAERDALFSLFDSRPIKLGCDADGGAVIPLAEAADLLRRRRTQ